MKPNYRNDVIERALRLPIVGSVARTLRTEFGAPRLTDFDSPSVDAVPDGEFAQFFVEHDGREINKWVHYFSIYDQLLGDLRSGVPEPDGTYRPLRFLEIGVSYGGSLEIWRKYFGNDAVIVGVDIDPRCADPTRPDLDIRIGSQTDGDFLRRVIADMGGVDVVLDDGSHVAGHQRASFDVLFPLLSERGLYIAEDLHTSYWLRHGGGYRRRGTFIEVAKSLVDGMHAWYFRVPVPRRSRVAQSEISSVQFFDSVVAIRKERKGRPQVMQRGTPMF